MKKGMLTLSAAFLALLLSGCGQTTSSAGSASKTDSSATSGGSGTPASSSATSKSPDSSGAVSSEAVVEDATWNGKVKIYYHRDDAAYSDKRLWVWAQGVGGDVYGETAWDNADTVANDSYGLYKEFDMSQAPWAGNVTTYLSFIVKKAGTWADQSTDTECRFGRFVNYAVDNEITIYANAADGGIVETYAKKEDALGDRIASCAFTDWKTLHVIGTGDPSNREASQVGLCSSYELYAFDASYYRLNSEQRGLQKSKYKVASGSPNAIAFDIPFDAAIDPTKSYYVDAYFAMNPTKAKSKAAGLRALFDTADFKSNYTYTGADLGVTATHESSVFKLWAPTCSYVVLKIFLVGTPGDLMDPVSLAQNNSHDYEMSYSDHGVWTYTLKGDYLDNEYPYFYTYSVTNSVGTNEVCDPYAKATGINGRRAAILDFDALDKPDGWDAVETNLPKITSPNQLSVYEAHIRDLTADKTWISNKSNRNGTYNAFSESGTTYSSGSTSVKTGRDNISEMKFSAIQLLPVFDQDNDERWLDSNGKITTLQNADTAAVTAPSYNWGYNPLNYNVVEGAYSSNPYRPSTRIYEYKNLISSYAKDGIRIIMDVVYNHVSSANNSAFQKIVPYYYFRTNSEGYFTNGSGVGNEIATERPMASSFIVNSLCFWAKEYKIKGFRFDVMGVIDGATMKAAAQALEAIDSSIVLYGEGWTADGSYSMSDKTGTRATMASCYTKLFPGTNAAGEGTGSSIGIGSFNSVGKSALKGEEHLGWGFMNKGSDWGQSDKDGVTYMLNGHVHNGSDLDYANPTQTVNYASCHDNYTQYDQMNYTVGTGPSSAKDSTVAMEATVASCAAVMFSEGISFTQGGEEIFRQKVMTSDNDYFDKITSDDYVALGDGSKLVRNSYMYGDAVNSYKWDRKVTYNKYFESFKAASVARANSVEAILGRPYDGTSAWGAKGISGWTDAIDHGCGIAYQASDNAAHYYYGFLLGRINSSTYGSSGGTTQIGIGNGTYSIVYDSYGRTGSISVSNYKLAGYQNEFLVIKNF
jgi:pullulanase/glycogen debranching enzyme